MALERGMLAGGGSSARPSATSLPPSPGFDLLTDAEVMLRVKAGDDAAFDHLVEKFRRPLVGFLYRLAHSHAVAEELAQEVFLRVYRSRQSYKASAKFTTWMYRIATNLAVNYARDTRGRRGEVSLDEPTEGGRPSSSRTANPRQSRNCCGGSGCAPSAAAWRPCRNGSGWRW